MNKKTQNIIMSSDSYKYSHTEQYPSNMVSMFDYAEARTPNETTTFVGLQYIIKSMLCTKITMDMVDEAKMFADIHSIPFEYNGWSYIANELNGNLPIRIRAVPEGMTIPTKNVLFTVESTDTKVPWVTSWAETILMRVWYPSNVATFSNKVKSLLQEYADISQDNPDVSLQFHNFGSRGSSTEESSALGGFAHLTQFKGSDNFNSMKLIKEYYKGNTKDFGAISMSIPASEHSSVTSWGKENEFKMVDKFLEKNKGRFIMACVADSYDYYNFVDTITQGKFAEKINSDEYPIFVIRPDSGNPAEIVPETLRIMENNNVPFTVNTKGFKVFNKYRIIWGDGISIDSIRIMLDILKERGYSSENIAFGIGGSLMQGNDSTSNNRDTQGWAIKCSSINIDEGSPIDNGDNEAATWNEFIVERDVYKDPKTDSFKKSKKGRITTFYNKNTETYFVDRIGTEFEGNVKDVLVTVFENGSIVREFTMDEIREAV